MWVSKVLTRVWCFMFIPGRLFKDFFFSREYKRGVCTPETLLIQKNNWTHRPSLDTSWFSTWSPVDRIMFTLFPFPVSFSSSIREPQSHLPGKSSCQALQPLLESPKECWKISVDLEAKKDSLKGSRYNPFPCQETMRVQETAPFQRLSLKIETEIVSAKGLCKWGAG